MEYKEDIASGCRAAAAGGFTAVCPMPNTDPMTDCVDVVQYIRKKAENANGVKVLPSAAITVGEKGEELTDMAALKAAGVCGFSEDGRSVSNLLKMREAMMMAKSLDMPIFDHTQQHEISDGGCMHRGRYSELLEMCIRDRDWDDSTRTAIVNTDQAKQEITITGIKVQTNQTYSGSGKYTLVSITADKSLKYGGYKTVMLSDPYRCYVDIASSKLGSGVKDQSVDADKSYVSKVRTGVTGSTVRIVCDLKAKATPELSYSTDGKTMILAFAESGTAVNEPSDKPDNPPDNTGNNNSSSDYDPYADGKLVVCIDPGHGVTTGGKRSPDESLREYEFNRDVAYRLKALLEAQGVTCIMTVAKEDQTLSLIHI